MHEILIANDSISIIDKLVPIWSAQNMLILHIQVASDAHQISPLIIQIVKLDPVVTTINIPSMAGAASTKHIPIQCPSIIAILSSDFTTKVNNLLIAELLRQSHIESDDKASTRHRSQKINRRGWSADAVNTQKHWKCSEAVNHRIA